MAAAIKYQTGLNWKATCLLRRARLLGFGDTDGLGTSRLCGGLGPRLACNSRSSIGSVKNSRLGVASRRARALSCHYVGLLGSLVEWRRVSNDVDRNFQKTFGGKETLSHCQPPTGNAQRDQPHTRAWRVMRPTLRQVVITGGACCAERRFGG